MKNFAHSLLIVGLFVLAGCGSAEQGGQSLHTKSASGPQIVLDGTDWKSPVTETDLNNFLAVIKRLPNQEVPPFAKMELDQQSTSFTQGKPDVKKLRESFRAVFDPQWQGGKWKEDSELVASFQQMQIAPQDFAALVTKISVAWSASAIRGEIPILATQRKLREQLEKLEFEMLHPLPGQTEYEREHRVAAIRDTVALSELLNMVSMIPEESIQVMKANEDLLHEYLPPARLNSKLAQCFESSPKVIRVGHSTR